MQSRRCQVSLWLEQTMSYWNQLERSIAREPNKASTGNFTKDRTSPTTSPMTSVFAWLKR